jgi:hypothetical protein
MAKLVVPFQIAFDPARYPESYLRMGFTEAQVQAYVVAYLRAVWKAQVTVVDVGDAKLRGRAAAMLRSAGADPHAVVGAPGQMEQGVVDLAVSFPHLGGRAGWFEVKRPSRLVRSPRTGELVQERAAGAPTAAQVAFLERQRRAGAVVGVVWRAQDLDELVPAASGEGRAA